MDFESWKQYVLAFITIWLNVIYGMIWWAAMSLNKIRKGETLTRKDFIINLFLSWFIGWTVWHLVFGMWEVSAVITAWSGFLSYPIINIIEKEWPKELFNFFIWYINRKWK